MGEGSDGGEEETNKARTKPDLPPTCSSPCFLSTVFPRRRTSQVRISSRLQALPSVVLFTDRRPSLRPNPDQHDIVRSAFVPVPLQESI